MSFYLEVVSHDNKWINMHAAFFDVDGTLTATRVWLGIMKFFQAHRLRRSTHLAFLAYHYPLYLIHRFGLITEAGFRAPWAAHLGWYFRGYTLEDAENIWDWVVVEYVNKHLRTDLLEVMDTHRQEGDFLALVSGGPLPLLNRIARELGVEHVIGTSFEIENGRYTGRVSGPVCLDEYKVTLSHAYLKKNGYIIDFDASYAYADAISDKPLLDMVGNPVAVYPSSELREVALKQGWRIFPSVDYEVNSSPA
ncbi:MAG: HAD family hydrolase [Anaerolineales bacterium]|nr:HAD family hydrolase [Anaerolineales bacterium]